MPPMPPMPMGNDPMMGDTSPMDEPQGEEPPVDGEEDSENGPGSDVKKYSGELSQALNTYNEENPNDEEKINKYAINMIAAQVANNLSDKDKRSVIKKLNGDEDDMSSDEQPMQDEQEPMPQMENRIVSEIADEKNVTNKKVTKHNPFVSNR